MLKRYSQTILVLAWLFDMGFVLLAWFIAYLVRFKSGLFSYTDPVMPPFSRYMPMAVVSVILAGPVYGWFGLYAMRRMRNLGEEIADCFKSISVAWLITFVLVSFAQPAVTPRIMIVLVLAVWLVLTLASRLLGRSGLRWLRRRGWNLRSAAIVGTGRLAQSLFHAVSRARWTGIEFKYFVDGSGSRTSLCGLDVVGPAGQLTRIIAERPVDIVFIAASKKNPAELEAALDQAVLTNVDVRVVPDLLSFHFLNNEVSQLNNLPIISLTHSPQHGINASIKRVFDLVASAMLLVMLAVPMLIIALAVKTSRGPVFYRQKRAGLGGTPFSIIKFRTMQIEAEARTGPVHAQPNDPRVTPVGRFLRKTGLDELPQLLNVLKGDMSLVGPRPERPELIDQFRNQIPRYMLRHHVRAGLTGWAQVYGLRGQTSIRKRVQYDIYYITNWSFLMDVKILLMTPFRGVWNANAY